MGPIAASPAVVVNVPERVYALAASLVAALVLGGLSGGRAFGSWESSGVMFLRKRLFLWVGILLPWSRMI